jgi:DNA repair exonuclease SbcCD ATPase subunit
MKITDVWGKDFLTLGEVAFSLNNSGLCLIQGVNKDDTSSDSNGSGKSSIADLINWTIWGTTARGLSGDSIIRDGQKEAKGSLILMDEDTEEFWAIERSRKKGKETLDVTFSNPTQEPVKISYGTIKLTQEAIAKIIGCSEEVFRSGIYIGQEALVDLPALTDKRLKETIEEAAGVQVLERAYEIARDRARKAGSDLDSAVAHHDRNVSALANAELSELNLGASVSSWETIKHDTINKAELIVTEKQTYYDHQVHISAMLSIKEPKWKGDRDRCDKELISFNDERKEESRLLGLVAGASRAETVATGDLRRKVVDFKKLQEDLLNINSTIGQPCSECGTAMTEDHVSHASKAISSRIPAKRMEAVTAKSVWQTTQEATISAQAALDAHTVTMRDPSTVTAERDTCMVKLREIDDARRVVLQAKEDCKRAYDNLKAEQTKINPYHKMLKEQQELIVNLGMAKDASEVIVQAKDAELAMLTNAVQVYSPAGVRAHILDEVTPFLNDRTSDYLGTLSDGNIQATWNTLSLNAKGELKERFAIDVTHAHGGKQFAALSGGEKRKVRLACALALQDLVASRATKPINLWIGDEIDNALDDAGLERLMMVLQKKAKDRGSVLIISHSNLTDWIDTVWTVTKQDDCSILSMT